MGLAGLMAPDRIGEADDDGNDIEDRQREGEALQGVDEDEQLGDRRDDHDDAKRERGKMQGAGRQLLGHLLRGLEHRVEQQELEHGGDHHDVVDDGADLFTLTTRGIPRIAFNLAIVPLISFRFISLILYLLPFIMILDIKNALG